MATGAINKPYEGYREYTLTKIETATNWTLIRSHACKQGKIAFIQVVVSVTSSHDGSAAYLIQLPDDLKPAYAFESRFVSAEQNQDYNLSIETNGKFNIRAVIAGSGGNIRADLCYPTAS